MGTGTGSDCHLARSGLKVLAGSEGSRSAWEVTPSWDDGEGHLLAQVTMFHFTSTQARIIGVPGRVVATPPGPRLLGCQRGTPLGLHWPPGPRPGDGSLPTATKAVSLLQVPQPGSRSAREGGMGPGPLCSPGNLPRPSADTGEKSVPRCPVQAG